MFNKNWSNYKLKELCLISSSKRIYQREYRKEGIPFYRSKEIILKHNDKRITDPLYISKKRYEEIKNKFGVPKIGDILLTSVGTLGVPYIVKKDDHFYFKDGNLTWFKNFSEKIYYLYLYYWLLSNNAQGQINSIKIGSSQSALTIGSLLNLNINIPEIRAQRKIASILSAYDELIENNNRRIEILEEIAEAVYREWFVHFRFPGHEKIKMVDSELGEIPEEWGILELAEVLKSIESGSRPKGGIDPEERGVPSIGAENVLGLGRYDFGKEKYVSEDFYQSMRKGKIQSGDVLLYKDGAKIGRKSMFRNGFPHKVCCINEHVFILRTNSRCSQNYLFFYLNRLDITEKIINLNSNAAQPGINQVGVKSLLILLPFGSLIRLFDENVGSIIDLLFNLAKRNQILRKKRGILLPKLISGKIDVSDLDIKIEDIK